MKYTELKKHIADGKLAAAYYFSGSDEFLKSWSLRLFKAAIDNPELNFSQYDGADVKDIVDALEAYPAFSNFRIVCIDAVPSDFSPLAGYFLRPSDTSVLITYGFPETKNAKKKQELDALRKYFTEIDCSPLESSMLRKWIAGEAEKQGAVVSPEAADLLIEYTSRDLTRISSELNKLAGYRRGETVLPNDVKAMVAANTEYKIWELSGAICSKDRAKALAIAEKFEQENTDFVSVYGAVYKHFRNLFYVTCCGQTAAAEALEINQSALYRLDADAKRFGIRKLKNIIYAMADIDFAFKSGSLDKDLAVRAMITGIMDAL